MKLIRTKGRGAQAAAETLAALERRGGAALDAVLPAVKRIVADVRKRGDRALLRYAAEFDGLSGTGCAARDAGGDGGGVEGARSCFARCVAHGGRRRFADLRSGKCRNHGMLRLCEDLTTGQLVRPLGSVGCYVPSGRHPLPSTLLMTAIPAQVAGVERIVVVSPKPAPETLAAAHLAWASRSSIGWAARMPWRRWLTERRALPRVDKIVGPGNLYVTAAKRLVAFDCAIDMLAGPTEIVVTSERGTRRGHCERSGGAGGARSGGAGDFCDDARRSGAGGDCRNKVTQPRKSGGARGAAAQWPRDCGGLGCRGARDHEPACARASDSGCGKRSGVGRECGIGFCGPLVGAAAWATTSPGRITRCRRVAWRECAAD